MGFAELLIFALSLSMDAFAVSVCKGLSVRKATAREAVIVGLYFGFFQAAMPVGGYFLGRSFASKIQLVGDFIAFALLAFIGIKMIRESFAKKDSEEDCGKFGFRDMLPLAVATSIDAFMVGLSFAFLEVEIFSAAGIIGIVTFALSVIGVKTGSFVGEKLKRGAELLGGVVLIAMGAKILIGHFMV